MDADQDVALVQESRSIWFIPGAIIAAGVLLAISIYVVRTTIPPSAPKGDISYLRPVSDSDHIIGNPTAPVVIIEYADMDSSYTKTFQQTMQQIMAEYAPGGKVAWVYRHFPLIDQYRNSEQHAEAAECASALGTTNTFWTFIDILHARAPGNQVFNPQNYDSIIESLGVDPARFESCMQANTYRERVSNDISNAIEIGAYSTPTIVVVIKGQKKPVLISGALPYDAMKKIIQESIAKTK
ncbi:MAG: Periplasmic thiol:disulfide interchange protein DsbA [Parcubacteria bacterium C7867-007]|nr:MAG: Periplasmic thiol:disulfide interchange protein DsbA [Parcubacteria bacterium C7867-007]